MAKTYVMENEKYVYDDEQMVFLPNLLYEKVDRKNKVVFYNGYSEYPNSIAINMVNKCNLNCSYCYANQGEYNKGGIKISLEDAQKLIDFVVRNVIEHNDNCVKITFFGGEPLLAFKDIQALVSYCRLNFPKIKFRFGTITNGTLLNKEIIKYLTENKFGLTVSIDGGIETHDINRRFTNGDGSYNQIVQNLNNLQDVSRCSIRTTITNENYKIDENIRELLNNTTIKKFTFGVDNNISSENYNKFLEHYDKLYEQYYNDILTGNFYDVTNLTRVIINLIYRIRNVSYCKSGVSYFALASDGNIYTCHRFASNESMKVTDINDIEELNEYSKIMQIKLEEYISNLDTVCTSCEFKNLCGGSCHFDSYCENGEQIGYSKNVCRLRKKTFNNIFNLLIKLDFNDKEAKTKFIKYLLNSKNKG